MSKTKIEQYPNSLMTVSKLLTNRMKKNMPVIAREKTNIERNEFYKNKEQYKNNIDEILDKINNVEVYLDELMSVVQDQTAPIPQITTILRKIMQELIFINKNYKNKIIKKFKSYDLYDLQDIENESKQLMEKWNELYNSNEIGVYLMNNDDAIIPLLNKIKNLFNENTNLMKQTSQKQIIEILPAEQRGEQYIGGYLSSISDSLASEYSIN